jgi:hypothetical protein
MEIMPPLAVAAQGAAHELTCRAQRHLPASSPPRKTSAGEAVTEKQPKNGLRATEARSLLNQGLV